MTYYIFDMHIRLRIPDSISQGSIVSSVQLEEILITLLQALR